MDKSKKNDNIISIVINIGIIVVFAIFVVFVIITLLELSKKTTDVISFIGEVINKRENITTANQNENENTLLPYADMITTTKYAAAAAKEASITFINNSNLKAAVIFKGLRFPTSMAFIAPNDFWF